MGNKRVGLLRTEALFENLKRELKMNGSKALNTHRKIIEVTDTVEDPTTQNSTVASLKMSDSGALVFLNPTAPVEGYQPISIPLARAESAGWWCDIVINHPIVAYDGGLMVFSGPQWVHALSVANIVVGSVLCGTPVDGPPLDSGAGKVGYAAGPLAYAVALITFLGGDGNSLGGGFLHVEIIGNNLWKVEGTSVCVDAGAPPGAVTVFTVPL